MFEMGGFFPTPQTIDVKLNSLPKALEGLSVLHLSDLHINKKTPLQKIEKLIQTANELNPNIIVITGDIIDTKAKDIEDKLMLFNLLKPQTYFISGNHDLYYGLDELVKSIEDYNIHFVDNKVLRLSHKGNFYFIAGLADRFSKFFGKDRDIQTLIRRTSSSKPLIFLAHQPKDYKIAKKCGATLFLAGHTHGGQVFPFHYLVRLVQPFLAGLHIKDNMALYINRGFGNWGVNLRFLAPSEITLLKLKGV